MATIVHAFFTDTMHLIHRNCNGLDVFFFVFIVALIFIFHLRMHTRYMYVQISKSVRVLKILSLLKNMQDK